MTRPLASLPHPMSELATQIVGKAIMTPEWYRKFFEIVDRIPVTGTVAFASSTSALVTFATPELSTEYNISLDAPENRTWWVTSKTITGFTANVSSASSTTIGWTLTRR